jgi:hypothetical protein
MLTEKEKEKLTNHLALIVVASVCTLTFWYAIYFIINTLKKWY